MKGQIFLITSVIVVLTLVLLKNSIDITSVIENKRSLEIGLERLEFENARNELVRTVDYSYNTSRNITGKVDDYLRFARNSFNARTTDFRVLEVAAVHPTVTSGSLTRINFTVFNLMGRELDFVNLTFSATNVSTTLSQLQDGIAVEANSTFSTTAAVNYTLTVFWNTSEGNNTEQIRIPVEVTKSKFTGFFDVQLKSNRLKQRDKVVETIDLPT